MADLSFTEQRALEALLQMGDGHVLDLSRAELFSLVKTACGRDISGGDYAELGDSKAKRLRSFLRKESAENVATVLLELFELSDPEHHSNPAEVRRVEHLIARMRGESFDPEATKRIWGDSPLIRIFISHASEHKADAARLAATLSGIGCKAFVAHEDIKRSKEWFAEIRHALHTMDAMVAYLTPEYSEKPFCEQEIGFALSRSPDRLFLYSTAPDLEPPGFFGLLQAMKGGEQELCEAISSEFREDPRFVAAAVDRFVAIKDEYNGFRLGQRALVELARLDLRAADIESVVDAINEDISNNQLRVLLEARPIPTGTVLEQNDFRSLLEAILERHPTKRFVLAMDTEATPRIRTA